MVTFLLASILMMSVLWTFCSVSDGPGWGATYGGAENEYAYSLIQTSDGGYAMAGYTSSYGAGGADFWLVKTDSSGNKLWDKTYGGTGSDYAYSLIQTSDGGYAMAGATLPIAGTSNLWLVKTNSGGGQEILAEFGGSAADVGYSLVQTSDGGYALAGYTYSYGSGGADMYLVKTSAAGGLQWYNVFGDTGNDYARSIVQTSDGGYAMAGNTASYGAGGDDLYLITTTTSGLWQQARWLGGSYNDNAYSLIQTSDGGYATAGYTSSYGAGAYDMWLVKWDEDAYLEWNVTYGGGNIENARSLVQTSDGGYAMAGNTASYGAGGTDFWLVKVPADEPPSTVDDYNDVWSTTDFTITLTATDDFTDVLYSFYKINDDTTERVDVNGQPIISTEGANNKLEYWSIDTLQNEETPHKTLTGIKLDKTAPTGSIAINGGESSTTSTAATLSLTYNDATSGVKQVRYSNDGVWDTETWEAPTTSKTWTLTSGEGTKTVYYQIEDNAGLASITYSDTISLTPPTQASPFASFTVSPSTQETNKQVTFNAAGSNDPDGTITTYAWDFGDGNTGSGETTTHSYTTAGTYTAKLTVTDNDGATGQTTKTITITGGDGVNASPFASFTVSPSSQEVNKQVTFNGAGSSDSDGSIEGYAWDFGDGNTGSGETTTHSYTTAGTYTAKLTVTDNDGATATTTKTITITGGEAKGSVKINNGAPSTNTATVTLNLADPSSSVTEMRFSNDNNEWSDWQTYTTTSSWTLTQEDGTKTVYVQFKDNTGQVATYSDTITLTTRGEPAFPIEYVIIAVVVLVVALIVVFIIYKWLKRPKKPPAPAQLRITAEPANIVADGETKSIITLQLLDKNGKPISAINDTQVQISATKGKIEKPTIVVPKGKDAEKTVIVSSRETGEVPVTAEAEGLRGVTITLNFLEKKRYCMHCGAIMPPKAKACQNCGKAPPAGVDTKVCHNCKSVIPVVAKFCSECGTGQKQ
jgi:PKD repeat protein/ribosomal protein L40E